MGNDEFYMARALQLARMGRFTTAPNPNVGCVIVQGETIVGEGFHAYAGEGHAEVHALRMAGALAHGATAYVTLEPCSHYGRTPPCADALVAAGIKRVVIAMQDPNPQVAGRGVRCLQQAGVEVCCGVMSSEAEALNRGFLKRMRTGFPYVQLKLASSLDGRIAMSSGESKWITSAQARQDVQCFRAESAAILTTSETVLADDPAMTLRWQTLPEHIQQIYPQANVRQPIRVIIDSKNRVKPEHRIVQQPGKTLLMRLQADSEHWPSDVEQIELPGYDSYIDLVALMMVLAKRQINSVWVEAGAKLAGALLQAGVVDELIVYMAPKLLGDSGRALCVLPGLEHLCDVPTFAFDEVRYVGPDLRLRLKING